MSGFELPKSTLGLNLGSSLAAWLLFKLTLNSFPRSQVIYTAPSRDEGLHPHTQYQKWMYCHVYRTCYCISRYHTEISVSGTPSGCVNDIMGYHASHFAEGSDWGLRRSSPSWSSFTIASLYLWSILPQKEPHLELAR